MNRGNKEIMKYDIINDNYVIKTPDDAIHSKIDVPFKIDLYITPYGPNQINEVSDSTYVLGNFRLPYHYHNRGLETFIVHKGHAEATLNGKKFILEEGDMINIEPWCPHGFVFIDEGFVWREMFTDMNMWADHKDRWLIARNGLPLRNDRDFVFNVKDGFDKHHWTFDMPEPVDCKWVDKRTIPEVTCKGEGKAVFEFEGIKCLLKVGRWQLRGFKEVWEYQIKKGYQLQYYNVSENEGVYFVRSGRFMVEVDGEVLFASMEEGDLIHIPAYTPYALTAVSDDCVIHDYNVSANLFRLLEMIKAAQDYFPDKLEDPEYMKYLFKVNKVRNFTKFEKSLLIATDYNDPVKKIS